MNNSPKSTKPGYLYWGAEFPELLHCWQVHNVKSGKNVAHMTLKECIDIAYRISKGRIDSLAFNDIGHQCSALGSYSCSDFVITYQIGENK
jgi:hypothetical protein